jgi:hypothetical protein
MLDRRNCCSPEDERALVFAVNMPKMVPSDRKAERLIALLRRCEEVGFNP